ncbi:MAG: hypothetical protein ACE5O2_02615 [Armatimonadota bacterium]
MGEVTLTVRLTEEEYERLRRMAEAEGRALEELGADAVRRLLSPPGGNEGDGGTAPDYDAWLEIAQGLGKGGPPDLADRHDDYLERARRECRPSS